LFFSKSLWVAEIFENIFKTSQL